MFRETYLLFNKRIFAAYLIVHNVADTIISLAVPPVCQINR